MREPPQPLRDLLYSLNDKSEYFLENIRSYSNMFAFTSMGGKIERSTNVGCAPPVLRIHGQNYHLIRSLLPTEGSTPKFALLYIYDTDNEI
ncbi:hypothetical protein ACS0TY_012763 [Phlomoides rotata]